MNIKVAHWKYLGQDCVLAQSTDKEDLEKRAIGLRAAGYSIEIQPNEFANGRTFYTLLATKRLKTRRRGYVSSRA